MPGMPLPCGISSRIEEISFAEGKQRSGFYRDAVEAFGLQLRAERCGRDAGRRLRAQTPVMALARDVGFHNLRRSTAKEIARACGHTIPAGCRIALVLERTKLDRF